MTPRPNRINLNVTLPAGLHREVRDFIGNYDEYAGQPLSLLDFYTRAVERIAQRTDAGEHIIFAAHVPPVEQHAVRLEQRVGVILDRFRDKTTISSFISTATRLLLKELQQPTD